MYLINRSVLTNARCYCFRISSSISTARHLRDAPSASQPRPFLSCCCLQLFCIVQSIVTRCGNTEEPQTTRGWGTALGYGTEQKTEHGFRFFESLLVHLFVKILLEHLEVVYLWLLSIEKMYYDRSL